MPDYEEEQRKLVEAAKEIVKVDGYSVANLQRKMMLGYTRAVRIIDTIKAQEYEAGRG